MNTNLIRCPFCGSDNVHENKHHLSIQCHGCGIIFQQPLASVPSVVRNSWNQRYYNDIFQLLKQYLKLKSCDGKPERMPLRKQLSDFILQYENVDDTSSPNVQ